MFRNLLFWAALALLILVPIVAALFSPLLAWRDPIYILSGFAGILGLVLLLLQPLLIGGYMPNVSAYRARRFHKTAGILLVLSVITHVGGLWITSPPDVIDALLFASPTTFSIWGVVAMWAVFASAILAVFRRQLALRIRTWRVAHTLLASIIVVGTILHAELIEGTMEPISKAVLCIFVFIATALAIKKLRVWIR